MSGSCWEALTDVRKWLGGPPKCLGVVGKPSRMFEKPTQSPGVVGRPSRMSGSCWEAFTDVRELSGGPHGCPGVVKSPSRMTGSVRESFPDVRVFGRPSRMTGSVRESFPDVQEESGAPHGCLGVVGTPFWMFRSGRETLPNS